jgi:hypothetical protein
MTKEAFHKTWYYRLLQVVFWGTLIPIAGALIMVAVLGVLGIYEEDIPVAGLFWAAVVALVYWVAKKIFYFVLFGESLLPQKRKA